MNMKISVTQDHISRGKKDDCFQCPVALALRERIGISAVYGAYFRKSWDGSAIGLPKTATNFIYDFDAGEPVEPIEFEIADGL